MRTQRATWPACLSSLEESRELWWCEEIRCRPPRGGEQTGVWHLGIGHGSLEIAQKGPRYTQTSSGAAGSAVSGFLAGPLQRGLGTDGAGTLLRFHIGDELGQGDFLGTHLEAERFAQAQIGHQLGV